MPLPTAYDEPTFAQYLLAVLGDMAGVLGWSTQTHVQLALDDTLLAYAVDTYAEATDIGRLRAVGRVAVWRQALASLTARVDLTDESGFALKRAQYLAGAQAALALAEAEAAAVGAATLYQVGVTPVAYSADPYATPPAAVPA